MNQPRGDVWAALEANREYTARVELNLTQQLGQISTQLAGLSASMMTEQKFEQLLARKTEQEERTRRSWEDERIAQLRGLPAEQREERAVRYQSVQAHSSERQTWLTAAAIFLGPLLSILLTHWVK